jgi:hypothetical protein
LIHQRCLSDWRSDAAAVVPTVLVPFWLILRAIIRAQLRRLRSLGTGE